MPDEVREAAVAAQREHGVRFPSHAAWIRALEVAPGVVEVSDGATSIRWTAPRGEDWRRAASWGELGGRWERLLDRHAMSQKLDPEPPPGE